MFPSSSNSFSYNQSMSTNGNPGSSIHQEINISPAPSFLEFPAQFLDNIDDQDHFLLSDFSHLLSQQQQQIQQGSKSSEIVMADHEVATNVITSTGKKSSGKRRSGKKDRHSKIYTAQGPRDRRMRLSLPIARKFFDLQDMLGFDKASKTIEWLFSKSKAAIKDLTCVGGGMSLSTSESEVVSMVKMSSTSTHDGKLDKDEQVGDGESSGTVAGEMKKKKSKRVVKHGVQLLQTREFMDKRKTRARARARERIMEKMKIKRDLGSCSQEMNEAPSLDELLGHQMTSVNIMEKLLGTTSPTPSSIFNCCNTADNIGISRSAGTKSKDIVIPGNWGIYNESYYCALTNTKPSPGNPEHHLHHQLQNPSEIFVTNPNCQQQKPTSNGQEKNPNSALYPSLSEQNPAGSYPRTSLTPWETVLFSYDQSLQESHFSENSNFPSKYGCFY